MMDQINCRCEINKIETFKRGAGIPLKKGLHISIHYSIAINVEDIHAEKFIESSYISNNTINGILGKEGSFSNIVNTALEGQNALCTVRVKVRLIGYSADIPRFILIELWPDTKIHFNANSDRFRKVNNYFPCETRSTLIKTSKSLQSCDPLKDDDKKWIKNKINEALEQSSGYVAKFTAKEMNKISVLLKTDSNWIEPILLAENEYLLTIKSFNLIKERLL